MYYYWGSAGLSLEQGDELNREIEGIATRLVQAGVDPSEGWDGTSRWTQMKTEQIYPDPGVIPAPPREPFLDPMAMAFLSAPLVFVSTFILGPASGSPAKNGGIITAGIVFWVAYIVLWIISGIWSSAYRESLRRYWARYDPHHRTRPQLRSDLESALKRAITYAWDEYHRPIATIPAPQVMTHPRAALPWESQGQQPAPMLKCTEREAEFLAMRWMEFLGATGCQVSAATQDGGADVFSTEFVAEVKHHASPVSPALVRQIFGVATAERKRALFFSLSGYSQASVQFAEQTGVALFTYDFEKGTLNAKSSAARKALDYGLPALLPT
jgi:hypothetical protein